MVNAAMLAHLAVVYARCLRPGILCVCGLAAMLSLGYDVNLDGALLAASAAMHLHESEREMTAKVMLAHRLL